MLKQRGSIKSRTGRLKEESYYRKGSNKQSRDVKRDEGRRRQTALSVVGVKDCHPM